jgi:AraC family transcriptional regulator, transcriptional activator of pobA
MRAPSITPLPFHHNNKPTLGFEIVRLSSIFARADQRKIVHPLDEPQRLGFHIAYIGISGRVTIEVDFVPVQVGRSLLTFAASGRVHSFVERGGDAWVLMFKPEFLIATPGSTDPLVLPTVLSPVWALPVLEVARAEHRELLALADRIDEEHAKPLDAIQPWLLSALLRAVLLRAERLAGARASPHVALATFFTILENDHTRTRSVAHYARASGISVRRLAELMVAETGRSTKQIIDERVIVEHKRLLAYTGESVKQIAERTGFDEPTNLVKFFRHHTGQTPLAFRAAQPTRRNVSSRRRS